MVTLEAIPQEGYIFTGWSGSIASEDNPVTFQMDCAKTILANFSESAFTLTVEIDGAGSVTPSAGTYQYGKDTVVDLSATPDEGFQFDGWTGEVDDITSATTTVTINSDTTIRANFSKKGISAGVLAGILSGGILVLGGIAWTIIRRRSVKA